MAGPLVSVIEGVDLRRPQVDRGAAELALWQHLSAVGAETTSFTWAADLEDGFEQAQGATTDGHRFWSPSSSGSWNRFSLWNPDAPISYPDRTMEHHDDPICTPIAAAVRATLGRRWRVQRTPRTHRRWRVSYAGVPDPVNAYRLAQAAADEEALVLSGKPVFDDFADPETSEAPIWRQRRQEWRFEKAARTYEAARYRLPVLEPLVRLWAAGVFGFWVAEYPHWRQRYCIIVPRPELHLASGRLHRDDGPAVEWPNGVSYWYWEGLPVPKRAAAKQSERARLQVLVRTRNQELRRMLPERIGYERFLELAGARLVQQDDYGKLWHTDLELEGEPVRTVEVVNATPEEDGSYRRYFLRVPPTIRTARSASAWTFGYHDANEYALKKQT